MNSDPDNDTFRPEYPSDLIKSGKRGKYSERDRQGTNVVLIDPDLHEKFPGSESVNLALRDYFTRRARRPDRYS